MNEVYSEVLEHLRQQHAMNTQEIRGRNIDNFHNFDYCGYNDVQDDMNTSWTFSFKGKIFLFLFCVMLFSCYLYGGQDVKKGAVMAWSDMNGQLNKLETENVYVKESVDYIREVYHDIKEFIGDFISE